MISKQFLEKIEMAFPICWKALQVSKGNFSDSGPSATWLMLKWIKIFIYHKSTFLSSFYHIEPSFLVKAQPSKSFDERTIHRKNIFDCIGTNKMPHLYFSQKSAKTKLYVLFVATRFTNYCWPFTGKYTLKLTHIAFCTQWHTNNYCTIA